MRRIMMKSKIHRAKVTDAQLDYEGSITVDQNLLDAANILPYEQVHVWDVSNGSRLITYAIVGERGSGTVCVNGAGAHLIKPGDVVIIATFAAVEDADCRGFEPVVVHVGEGNKKKG
jgi:aspartate 1-decarboxylase